MQMLRFPLAVLGTSVALVALLVLWGGFTVGNTLAAGLGGSMHNGDFGGNLPAQLSGLRDIPAGERFSHFRGVQVTLTDKDNHPVAITVTPGTVASASATSLTLNGNDGASHTFSLDSQTMRGRAGQQAAAAGQQVVVATVDGSQTAFAVITADQHGPFGPFGH